MVIQRPLCRDTLGLAHYSREQELGFYGRQLVSGFHSWQGCAPFLCAHIEGQDLPAGWLDKQDRIVHDFGPYHGPRGYVISRDKPDRSLHIDVRDRDLRRR